MRTSQTTLTLLTLTALLALPACDSCRGSGGGASRRGADRGGGGDAAASDAGPRDGAAPDGAVSAAARNLAYSLDQAAAEGLGSPCERAYAVHVALRRAAGQRDVPPPEEYMDVCNQLPEEMQLCLAPAYQVDHTDDCIAVRESLDPELLRRLQDLLRPSPAPPGAPRPRPPGLRPVRLPPPQR